MPLDHNETLIILQTDIFAAISLHISRSREGCNDESKEQCSNANSIESVEIDSPRTRKEFELIESKIHHWKENKVSLKEYKFEMLKSIDHKIKLMNQYCNARSNTSKKISMTRISNSMNSINF